MSDHDLKHARGDSCELSPSTYLQVAMNDFPLVAVIEAHEYLVDDQARRIFCHCAVAFELVKQISS